MPAKFLLREVPKDMPTTVSQSPHKAPHLGISARLVFHHSPHVASGNRFCQLHLCYHPLSVLWILCFNCSPTKPPKVVCKFILYIFTYHAVTCFLF